MKNWEELKKSLFALDPIFTFAQSGNIEGISKSISVMNIEAKEKRGYTPLMLAAYHGHIEAVKLLLKIGADIHARDNNGNSVLMAAAFYGHTEVVKILLENGADPEATNLKNQTALVFARTFRHSAIEKILTSHYNI